MLWHAVSERVAVGCQFNGLVALGQMLPTRIAFTSILWKSRSGDRSRQSGASHDLQLDGAQGLDLPIRAASGQDRIGVGVDPPDIDTSKTESVVGEDRVV